ncbi:hypothetical protein [Paraburkholderia aromaticivorans]|uniref:hypothetical protein n=1 Tax=Paraburkholderia aromaticivorans TaxID=2026199 RepID=UPI0038B93FF5
MTTENDDANEHLSTDGFFQQLLKDEQFIKDALVDPVEAVKKHGLEWDNRNNERLAIARKRVLDFAQQAFAEVRVLNFRNCQGGGT